MQSIPDSGNQINNKPAKILLIEDDKTTREGVMEALRNNDFFCDEASDGLSGYDKAVNGDYELILLDLILPSKNGMEICRDLRNSGNMTPVIMLTSKVDEVDKVIGLELGADDYVTKPFSIQELLARIKAVLRRTDYKNKEHNLAEFDDIRINFLNQELYKSGNEVRLSATEFKILHYLISHEGEVVSRNQLLDEVWGYDAFPTTRTVDNYILSLRKKIENDPSEPSHIITVPKAGYKFVGK